MSLCKGTNVADKQSVYLKRHVILKIFNCQNYLLEENCDRTCAEEFIRESDCEFQI